MPLTQLVRQIPPLALTILLPVPIKSSFKYQGLFAKEVKRGSHKENFTKKTIHQSLRLQIKRQVSVQHCVTVQCPSYLGLLSLGWVGACVGHITEFTKSNASV